MPPWSFWTCMPAPVLTAATRLQTHTLHTQRPSITCDGCSRLAVAVVHGVHLAGWMPPPMCMCVCLPPARARSPGPQIQEMARMTAAQRLELLKEVGGSTVYEERRNESQKLLEEAERKRAAVRSWACKCRSLPQLVCLQDFYFMCLMWRHACRLQGTVHLPCMRARVQWVVLMVLVCCLPSCCPLLACQIDETAGAIEEQIAQINADRAELLAYQALDKKQRGIEFALLDRELTSARKELAKVRNGDGKIVWASILTCMHGCKHTASSIPALPDAAQTLGSQTACV